MPGVDRPDVLILMTDQLNPYCLGCAGDRTVRTPHIDRLAAEGTRFNAAYTVSPVCMPARASFLSGLYPHNHQFWRNYTDRVFPEELAVMFRDIRDAGYFTAKVGKFHTFNPGWGEDFEAYADHYRAIGFEYAEETPGPFMTPFHRSNYTRHLKARGLLEAYQKDIAERLAEGQYTVRPSPVMPEDHNDAFIGRRAVEFIDGAPRDRPICLFVSFPGPHTPLDAPGEFGTMYDPADVELPPNAAEGPGYNRRGETGSLERVRRMRANYYGKITLIDAWVGRVVEAMVRRGRWEGALAFFLADHGDHMGAHGRVSKGSFFEESARVPLIVRWPGRVRADAETAALAEHMDVCPTILDAIGAARTPGHYGRSLLGVATGASDSVHEAVFSEISSGDRQRYMVRTPRYKWWLDGERERLFDMEADPYEMNDLAGGCEAVRSEMRGLLLDFLLETPFDRARDYQPLFTRVGIAAEETDIAGRMYRMFREFSG